ncbi:hypothetical protein Vadar_024059 [Vaccinium darrowii]|nr:hypothetical protein Vadar_024059 [Vaccinium darrowii]
MKQPQGYKDPIHPHFVCKLTKALYGLRQAPRAWFSAPRAWFSVFSSHLLSLGFTASKADTSLFVCHHNTTITLALVYVDDIIVTGNDTSFITTLIEQLSSRFTMKDLGDLHYFLGIVVNATSTGLFLSQTKYATEVLTKGGMLECKPSGSPTSSRQPVDPSEPLFEDVTLFRTLVGSLQYLTLTRPKIAFAVNSVCQHMHRPKISHYCAVKRVLRYIKGTLRHGLRLTSGNLSLTAYTDADWAGDPLDRRSTSGFVVFLGPNPVSWCAMKQPNVARSSTEAEYRAMAQTTTDLVWIQQLLTELHVPILTPHVLWCDNKSAMALACLWWEACSDVFSFGVVILGTISKMIVGEEVLGVVYTDDIVLTDEWAKVEYKDGCPLVDKSLAADPYFYESDGRKITALGMQCIDDDPDRRLAMKEAVEHLESLPIVQHHVDALGL